MTMIEKMWAMAAKERAATRHWLGTASNKVINRPKAVPKNCRNPDRLQAIVDLLEQGKTNAEIARTLGISDQSVRNWKRNYKLTS